MLAAMGATTTTTVPTKDAIKADFARVNLPGSPCATKNKIPVTTHKVITANMATGLTTLSIILPKMSPMVRADAI